ncbi:MAG: hypothetical protein ABI664_20870 [bacterium]
MSDSRSVIGTGAFGPEPPHDDKLGSLMRDIVGDTPFGAVRWAALAERIGERVAAQMATPWWSYATRWERRAIPLALVAGLAAAVALFMTSSSSNVLHMTTASGVTTAVLSGIPAEDAASQFAHTITSSADLTAGVPE